MASAPKPTRRLAPTSAQIKILLQLIKQAGDDKELRRWIAIAKGSRRGRPPGSSRHADYDEEVLDLATSLQAATKLPLRKVLKKLIVDHRPPPRLAQSDAAKRAIARKWTPNKGASPEAVIRRLLDKDRAERKAWARLPQAELELRVRKICDWIASLDEDDPSLKTLQLISADACRLR